MVSVDEKGKFAAPLREEKRQGGRRGKQRKQTEENPREGQEEQEQDFSQFEDIGSCKF